MFFLSVWKLTLFGITRISGKLKKGEKKIIFTLDRWFTGNLRCNLSFNLSSFCIPGSPLFVVISFGSIFFSLNIQLYVTQAFPLLRTFPQPILVVSAISLQESLTFGNPYIYHIETGIVYWLFRNWQKGTEVAVLNGPVTSVAVLFLLFTTGWHCIWNIRTQPHGN